MTLADAITQLENVNPSYNNPGAISGTGDTGTSFGSGIGIYSTLSAGTQALDNQLTHIYAGTSSLYPGGANLTLDQFGSIYSPGDSQYGSKLASILGVPSSTPLNQVTPYNQSSTSPWQMLNPFNWKGGDMSGLKTSLGIPNTSTIQGWFTAHLEDFTVIIVGLILIAAGLFAFKQTQTVIETAGRVGKRVAEISA